VGVGFPSRMVARKDRLRGKPWMDGGAATRALRGLLCLLLIGFAWSLTTATSATADQADQPARALALIRDQPLRAEGFAELATWLFRQGDLERAVAAAEEAVRLEPAVAHNQRLLGYVRAASGDQRGAETAFERASQLEPTARTSLADFHLARAWAEYQEAMRHGRPDPMLAERVRGLAAAAALSPELKVLLGSPRPSRQDAAADFVPPIALTPEAPYALVVEKHTQTARLYERDGSGLRLVQTYPCTTGQETGRKRRRDDRRTPDGVYFVTDLLPGDQLPDIYGRLALPLSYPNLWDRREHRGGYGIWLHGSDRLGSPFTPRETRGCVLLRNEDLSELARLVTPEITPVLIQEDIPYAPAAEWSATAERVLQQVPVSGFLALVGTPEYSVVLHRENDEVVRDFVQPSPLWRVVASERASEVSSELWRQKLAELAPDGTATLVGVRIRDDGDAPSIVIETSGPARASGFRPEIADRLYVDLPGVRPGPVPTRVQGAGSLVEQVRVAAAELDPPTTRVVIDLRRPAQYRIENEGNDIIVALSER